MRKFESAEFSCLPTREQTRLLRAFLWKGEEGRQAWLEWRDQVGDPIKAIKGGTRNLRRLLPLLHTAAERNGVSGNLLTYLRMAGFREELRSKKYRSILNGVLSAFQKANFSAVVLKGAALADMVYPSPALRHCHDIDMLIGQADLSQVLKLLSGLEFQPSNGIAGGDGDDLYFEHSSGLPLVLHRGLFAKSDNDLPFSEVWNRADTRTIAGTQARVLCPIDNLIHVCELAFVQGNRAALSWVSDSWFIIDRTPMLAWDDLPGRLRGRLIKMALYITLHYLAEEIHARIPEPVLDRLHRVVCDTVS